MNTFRPREGRRQKREVAYRVLCLRGSLRHLHTALCVRAESSSLPRSVLLLPVTLSCSAGGSGHGPLDPSLLWGPPGCGTEGAGEGLQAGVQVVIRHPKADELPCPETPHQRSWHSQANSQLPALSHPSLGSGSGNAAAFSGCLDFCLFLYCCFPGIPEKGLAGRCRLSAVNS